MSKKKIKGTKVGGRQTKSPIGVESVKEVMSERSETNTIIGKEKKTKPSISKTAKSKKKKGRKANRFGYKHLEHLLSKHYGKRFKDKKDLKDFSRGLWSEFKDNGVNRVTGSLLRKRMKGVRVKPRSLKAVLRPVMPVNWDEPFLYWEHKDFESKVNSIPSNVSVYGKTVLLDDVLDCGVYYDYDGGAYQLFVNYINRLKESLKGTGKEIDPYVYVKFDKLEVHNSKKNLWQVEVYTCDESGQRVLYGFGEDERAIEKIRTEGYAPKIRDGKDVTEGVKQKEVVSSPVGSTESVEIEKVKSLERVKEKKIEEYGKLLREKVISFSEYKELMKEV